MNSPFDPETVLYAKNKATVEYMRTHYEERLAHFWNKLFRAMEDLEPTWVRKGSVGFGKRIFFNPPGAREPFLGFDDWYDADIVLEEKLEFVVGLDNANEQQIQAVKRLSKLPSFSVDAGGKLSLLRVVVSCDHTRRSSDVANDMVSVFRALQSALDGT